MSDHLLLALPEALVERIGAEADRRGVDAGSLFIEFLSEELPDALAEAARMQLAHGSELTPNVATPSAVTDGVVDPQSPQIQAGASIPPDCVVDEDTSGGID